MPSTTSSSVSSDLASSTVITPSLPTRLIASPSMAPTSASPLAEMVPTWATSALSTILRGIDEPVEKFVALGRVGAGRAGCETSEDVGGGRSEEHTSELPSLMRISYAVFCLQKKTTTH